MKKMFLPLAGLFTLLMITCRLTAQQYTLDKQAGPGSLDDLVQSKYLGGIPVDPITRGKDWHLDSEDILLDPQQTSPGITDVHSSSGAISPFENTPYNTLTAARASAHRTRPADRPDPRLQARHKAAPRCWRWRAAAPRYKRRTHGFP